MPGGNSYRDLVVWQRGMELAEAIWVLTASFPRSETYGLVSQMRRAAVSIPSNIAEGACRRSRRAYMFHLSVAIGSHAELETCLELARRVGCLRNEDESLACVIASVGQLLNGLHRTLQRRDAEMSLHG
jgi:four helix bundle protein